MAENCEFCGWQHLSVVDRYFTPKYYINAANLKEDVCILMHSNRICIVTLAEHHPVLSEGKTIERVNYSIGDTDRLKNRVSGKSKRGAQSLRPESSICEITCTDGSKYTVPCGIKSQLVEVNRNLIENPKLLTEKHETEGHLAVLLPKLKEFEDVTASLLSKEKYYELYSSSGT